MRGFAVVQTVTTNDTASANGAAILLADAVVALGGFPALAGVNLTVRPGELVALRGANGTGKSTLLRLCAGLAALSRGSAQVMNVDLASNRAAVRPYVGLLGHRNGLYADLTARENVQLTAELIVAAGEDVDDALVRLKIDARVAATRTRSLSAGQRRRTALASLVVRRARVWLLDEPHAGLDTAARKELDQILREATQSGATVIYTTHEVDRADGQVPRTVTLAGGVVASDRAATRGAPQ
ncbi:MAG: heme ABC exporter ATP-binding protein CcmA [Actinomycetota bacterium]